MAIVKMYKGEAICDADRAQIKDMEKGGWSLEAPEVEKVAEKEVEPAAKPTAKKRRSVKKAE